MLFDAKSDRLLAKNYKTTGFALRPLLCIVRIRNL